MPLKSIQVLGNQVLLAEQHGIHIPEGMDWHDPEQIAQLRTQQPDLWRRYVEVAAERAQLRHCMAYLLEEARQDPASFGVQDFQWRECQGVLLRDQAWSLRNGYGKLASKLPTGGGKTHTEGAYARVALEAVGRDRWNDIEILALTSRANLVNQLSRGAGVSHSAQANQEGMGDGLDLGDLTRWLSPILTPEQIRILVGAPAVRERRKNAVVTIGTYQGLTERRIHELHSQREVLLIICDEMHNLSDRVRRLILTHFPGAMLAGLSATPQGPQRSPYLAFEEVRRPNHQENGPWQQGLASRQELSDLINRRELKPLRLLSSRTGISFADVGSEGGELNDEDVARVLTRNIPLLQQFLERLFTTQHPMLTLAGSRQPCERTWVAFVNRVSIATALARYCTDHLGIPATVMSGEDDQDAFDEKCCGLRTGQYRIAFSCRKAGEGLDVREIDGVLSLAPHGIASEWLLEQEIGRGERLIPGRPNADCLVVEPHYEDDPGLATTTRILRQPDFANGGLVVPGPLRDAEMTVTRLMRSGQSLMDALATLPADQRELLVEQWGLGGGEGGGGGGGVNGVDTRDNLELDVTFIHRDDVQLLIQEEDPVQRRALARAIMAENGIPDRRALRRLGVIGCWQITFGHIGGLAALYAYTVGTSLGGGVNVSLAHLEEIADAVELPDVAEETRAQWLSAMHSAGIIDRRSLTKLGVTGFGKKIFGDFGGARAFYSAVLGREMPTGAGLSTPYITEIADALALPDIADESRVRWRASLNEAGVPDKRTLWYIGANAFEKKMVGGQSAKSFYGEITGTEGGGNLSVAHLDEIAVITQLPEVANETLAMLLATMVDAGIPDRRVLQELGVAGCAKKTFGSIGGITSFYAYATGKRLGREAAVGLPQLEEIANVLSLPAFSDHTRTRCLDALRTQEITDRRMLQWHGVDGFWRMKFDGIGGGQLLYKLATGKTLASKMSPPNLIEIADALGLPEISAHTQAIWRAELAVHGITDRQSLFAMGSTAFRKKKFGRFKGASAFYAVVTGKSLKADGNSLRPDHLPEIADAVGLSA